jgi:hypothetical protein
LHWQSRFSPGRFAERSKARGWTRGTKEMEVDMLQKWMVTGALAMGVALAGSGAEAQQRATAPVVKGRQYTPPFYVFSPDVPADIVTHDVGAIGFQPFVDILAWDTFIALNWPAPQPIVQRGVPDRQNVVGGFVSGGGEGGRPSSMPVGPVVWETYKDTHDIFLDPPTKPAPFDTPERIPAACAALAGPNPREARVLVMTSKVTDVVRSVTQSDGNRLVDQNGQNVWYEIKVNRAYFDYVVDNGFYDSANQKGKTISFPSSSNDTATVPAIKVKAAWKVMGLLGSRQPDDLTKFYTARGFVVDPNTGQCTERLLGLVGLHVVVKTKQLPQWMWATFEHVGNAPTQGVAPPAGAKYNFNNPACPVSQCPVNTPPTGQSTMPTQVVRVVPINQVAASTTATYQTALKTLRPDNVWQNYMLVDAQWAGTRDNIGVPAQPKFLANATLETYMQAQTEPYGCINCHGKYAPTTDLDFQLPNAYPRSSGQGVQAVRDAVQEAVREVVRVPGIEPGTTATPPRR